MIKVTLPLFHEYNVRTLGPILTSQEKINFQKGKSKSILKPDFYILVCLVLNKNGFEGIYIYSMLYKKRNGIGVWIDFYKDRKNADLKKKFTLSILYI